MKTLLFLTLLSIGAQGYSQGIVDKAIIGLVIETVDTKFSGFTTLVSEEIDKRIATVKTKDSTVVYFKTNSMIGKGTMAEPFEPNPNYIKESVNKAISDMIMTTTQRNILKPTEGQLIWNSGLKTFQKYTTGAWK